MSKFENKIIDFLKSTEDKCAEVREIIEYIYPDYENRDKRNGGRFSAVRKCAMNSEKIRIGRKGNSIAINKEKPGD